MPVGFNDFLGMYLPKGSLDEDTKNIINRIAECTRRLGLKNTDNKTIAGVVNYAITPAIPDWSDTTMALSKTVKASITS